MCQARASEVHCQICSACREWSQVCICLRTLGGVLGFRRPLRYAYVVELGCGVSVKVDLLKRGGVCVVFGNVTFYMMKACKVLKASQCHRL